MPTDTVYRGTFGNADEALTAAEGIAVEKARVDVFRVLDGAHGEAGDVLTLNDVPVCFGPRKRYRDRQVTVVA